MTPVLLFLLFNAGMLVGFVLHALLDGAHPEDPSREGVWLQATPSFRDDLLVPILPSKNHHLH